MSTLTAEQDVALDVVRDSARELAGAIINASAAGISNAILLPELIVILREAGFAVPRGVERFLG